MARVTKKKETKKEMETAQAVKPLTRAEKKTATQTLIKDVLLKNTRKHNDLIDEVAKAYAEKFGGEETENINDVKGRVGSVLDIMKKDGEVLYEGGMYALKLNLTAEKASDNAGNTEEIKTETIAEKPAKKSARSKTKKSEKTEEVLETAETAEKAETAVEKTAVKKTAKKSTKALKTKEKKTEEPTTETEELPLPPAPIMPIAPVAPITPDVAPEPLPEVIPEKKKEEKGKKKSSRAKAKKTENTAKEAPVSALNEEKTAETANETPMGTPIATAVQTEIKNLPVVKEKAEIIKKDVVDMSFLFGAVKTKAEKQEERPVKTEQPIKAEKTEKAEQPATPEKTVEKSVEKTPEQTAEKPIEKTPAKQAEKAEKQEKQEIPKEKMSAKKPVTRENVKNVRKATEKPLTADERLREAFLKRMRALGGDYFEYYSVYLLERYSMKNGRRLEGMRISGGDHDGGIDGEIELTDKFGFKETIYIQSKNWDPEKGKEEYWVVGETLLQQFIGACACRQAKDGKQHCRGIFITTSRFTPDAKRILNDMSDKIVGYDGADLYEAAKECKFGLLYENGNWKLDEKLLSGTKAFFNMV